MDNTLRNLARSAGIRTGVALPAYDADRKKNTAINAPITEPMEVTVGANKDFGTFHEAMTWACNQTTAGFGVIHLMLDDGVHYIGEPEDFDEWWWCYYRIQSSIDIASANYDPTNCIITMPPTDDGGNWPDIFDIYSGGDFRLNSVTLDLTYGGYPYVNACYPVNIYRNSSLQCYDTSILNVDVCIYAVDGSMVYLSAYSFPVVLGNARDAIYSAYKARVMLKKGGSGTFELSNCTAFGIHVDNAGYVSKPSSVTFSGNAADTNIPLNQIQYDEALITDGTVALSFKP